MTPSLAGRLAFGFGEAQVIEQAGYDETKHQKHD